VLFPGMYPGNFWSLALSILDTSEQTCLVDVSLVGLLVVTPGLRDDPQPVSRGTRRSAAPPKKTRDLRECLECLAARASSRVPLSTCSTLKGKRCVLHGPNDLLRHPELQPLPPYRRAEVTPDTRGCLLPLTCCKAALSG